MITGFTTTIPLEILLAAGRTPLDLNNIFIGGDGAGRMVEAAEEAGFPRNTCGWIKGLYSAVRESGIREMVAVTEGDCSYTKALMEVLSLEGVSVVPFAFPHDRERESLHREMEKLMHHFQVDWPAVEETRRRLEPIRKKLWEIDRLTWQENLVSGGENHYYQVCSSDMNGNPERYERDVDTFLRDCGQRRPFRDGLRLAYVGVPPIFNDLYPYLESLGARVVFNETQRQFTMPFVTGDIVDQYLQYTYPYDIFHRLNDIVDQCARRSVDGVIHYVQSFCFRQIEDIIMRKRVPYPILTLEADKPGPLDARSKIRIEGFLEMLEEEKSGIGP